jgi:membrane protein YqaA with SNARE-associated domain
MALITSLGFGVLSAVFPFANAEAYVAFSQVSAVAGALPVAVGVGVGQTIGKLVLFQSVRQGRQTTLFHRQHRRLREQRVGPVRAAFRRLLGQLLALVGTKRWGLPIVLLAAVVGLPPLYAVALLAGATKMRCRWFVLVVLVGRLARFILVALGFSGWHWHP